MRAETQVRGSVAAIPAFESEAAAASFRLSLLVGQQPEVLDPRLREPGQLPAADVEIAAGLRSDLLRSEEHTSELQSLMRISYAVFCLKKKKTKCIKTKTHTDYCRNTQHTS